MTRSTSRRVSRVAWLAALVWTAGGAAEAAGRCADAVQGEIAWNYRGDARWNSKNVSRLCRGAEDSVEPARCFERVMHGGVDWGGGTRWSWKNAVDLCRGTRDADGAVECFESRVAELGWRDAIESCQWDLPDETGEDTGATSVADVPVATRVLGDLEVGGAAAIEAKYRELGGASGRLGEPRGGVRTNPGETGKRRRYAHGHIYWSEATGAHVVYDGPIWEKWADRRWEQGELGYPVADPERRGLRWVQRFEGGRLSAVRLIDTPAEVWEEAGRPDFAVRPQSGAERCVADVEAAFSAIDFGRRSGKNFYTRGAAAADAGDAGPRDHVGLGGHMQGVARLPGGWLAQSWTHGVFLTHFPAHDGSGYAPWATSPDDGEAVFPDLPRADRGHVGGVHAYEDVVVVPSDARLEVFRHSDRSLDRLAVFDLSRYQPGAHFASILPLESGDWLLAVGRDSRRRRKAHRVHFYVIPELAASQSELRYLGRWGRGRTLEDFQSASLVAECDGDVFLIGTGVRRVQSNAHAKLYRIRSFEREAGGAPRPEVVKVKERSPGSQRNDCSLNAAATFFATADHRLAMYCTEKEIRRGAVTTREYRDASGS